MTMDVNQPIDRRTLLLAGLGSAAAFAAGCASSARRTHTALLPSPVWPHQRTPTAVDAPVAAAPAQAESIRRVSIIPRTNWTSQPTKTWDTNPMAGISRVTVHHDGMDPVPLASAAQAADRLELIRKVHVETNGWADIGYHFAIDPAGRIWAARPLDRQGAHVRDQNEHNMGILVLGNFEQQTPTPRALAALDGLIIEAATANRIPLASVKTHREWNPTACPGASLQQHMNWTRAGHGRVAQALARA